MSTSGQHDTLRRVLTSAAIVSAALVMVDGGRGLTGRAGGGSVGCGGTLESVDPELLGAGTEPGHPAVDGQGSLGELEPVLLPGIPTLRFRAAVERIDRERRGYQVPNPERVPPSPGTAPVTPPAPGAGGSVLAGASSVGATRFAQLAEQVGLGPILDNPYRRFTVFAPSDEALAALESDHPDWFNEPKYQPLLLDILAHHVVVGRSLDGTTWQELAYQSLLPMAQLRVDPTQEQVVYVYGNAGDRGEIVPGREHLASNGYVHPVDQVLMPQLTAWTTLRTRSLNRFVQALEATDRVDELADPNNRWTVLAPSDSAFELVGWTLDALHDPGRRWSVEYLLDAHLVPKRLSAEELAAGAQLLDGKTVTVVKTLATGQALIERAEGEGSAIVVEPDIEAGDSVVHAIDAVLVP